jgi:hypothetical protein
MKNKKIAFLDDRNLKLTAEEEAALRRASPEVLAEAEAYSSAVIDKVIQELIDEEDKKLAAILAQE